ncbi:hypothetical protein CCACVL1_03673 [Corchorus capsularis]|uniref:CP12 domain-containing protein n=1 Tax=Corchorus capsularis TaxID=210143 RepID=A0A1R3JY26_COCAP|nr:hypothetical protein CCACVL1_03673 [Corchorus capsularis]
MEATLRFSSMLPTPSSSASFSWNPPRMISASSFHCINNKGTERVSRMRVKGMGGGGAKYKGTQMREKKLSEMIEKKVMEAKEVCEGDETSDECKVAWDEVEEENPETDECRVYED